MMNKEIIKNIELSYLFKIYENMLTTKQKQYFKLYIEDDLSLQEIADMYNISKTAIYDSIKKTTKQLYSLENKINLKQKEEKILSIIKKYEKNIDKDLLIKKMIKEIKEVI